MALAGSDARILSVDVSSGTTHLKVALLHPSLGVLCCNGMRYTVTVRDAANQVLGTTTETPIIGAGTSSVLIDLGSFSNPAVTWGTFTFDVRRERAVSDPDPLDSDPALGQMITVQVAQLTSN